MDRSCADRSIAATARERTSRIRSQLLIALACGVLPLLTSCARYEHLPERIGEDTRAFYRVRYAPGDDSARALPSYDDSAWTHTTTYDLPRPPAVLWLRMPVVIDRHAAITRTPGIFISALATCDVFWDGRLIGRTRDIDNFLPLPLEGVAEGTHLLAIRVQAPALPLGATTWFYGIGLGDYAAMVRSRVVSQIIPMIGAGAFLVVAAWYLAMWISMRRRGSVLAFAVLCSLAALLDFVEGYRALFNYPFEWHVVRLRIILALTFSVCVLLPLFLALEMQVRRPLLRIAALIPVLFMAALAADSHDGASVAMFSVSMIACLALVTSAVARKRWEVLPAAAGITILTATLIAGGYRFGDRAFFAAFSILILCLLVSLSIDLGRSQRQHQHTLLRAARLEAELLKKSIHPHFVMNTLTAVIEWIEENPAKGVRFLESLAEELRIFLDIASRALIPLEKEIALCRAHLRIMSCRKATRFTLETDGVHDQAVIPPAIFHTLVENAISHNTYDEESVAFTLREEQLPAGRRYVFSAPLRNSAGSTRGGLGMRYVTTRLEESYPGRWRIQSFAEGGFWQTAIEVPA